MDEERRAFAFWTPLSVLARGREAFLAFVDRRIGIRSRMPCTEKSLRAIGVYPNGPERQPEYWQSTREYPPTWTKSQRPSPLHQRWYDDATRGAHVRAIAAKYNRSHYTVRAVIRTELLKAVFGRGTWDCVQAEPHGNRSGTTAEPDRNQ